MVVSQGEPHANLSCIYKENSVFPNPKWHHVIIQPPQYGIVKEQVKNLLFYLMF